MLTQEVYVDTEDTISTAHRVASAIHALTNNTEPSFIAFIADTTKYSELHTALIQALGRSYQFNNTQDIQIPCHLAFAICNLRIMPHQRRSETFDLASLPPEFLQKIYELSLSKPLEGAQFLQVTTLHISGKSASSQVLGFLSNIKIMLPNLTTLALNDYCLSSSSSPIALCVTITQSPLSTFFQNISDLKALTDLDLSNNHLCCMTETTMQQLGTTLRELPNLIELNLSGQHNLRTSNPNLCFMEMIPSLLDANLKLTTLELYDHDIAYATSPEKIVQAIASIQSLTYLDLGNGAEHYNVDDSLKFIETLGITDLFSKLTKLRTLRLERIDNLPKGGARKQSTPKDVALVTNFANNLGTLTALTELDLSDNALCFLPSDLLIPLANALAKLSNLIVLELPHNGMDDDVDDPSAGEGDYGKYANLALLIEKATHLTSLNLDENIFLASGDGKLVSNGTDEEPLDDTATILITALEKLTSLRTVYLSPKSLQKAWDDKQQQKQMLANTANRVV